MSQPWVAGPVPIFIGLGSGFSPLFLGLSERGVNISFDPEYTPYVVDAAGTVPLDAVFQGASATIQFTLTSWREPTYALLADYAGVVLGSVRGQESFGEIGTLMGFERAAFPVWIPFPYSQKLAYAQMPQGYRFELCYADRDSLPERGTRASKLDIVLRAIRRVSSSVQDGRLGNAMFRLYDHDMSAVNGLEWNFNVPIGG